MLVLFRLWLGRLGQASAAGGHLLSACLAYGWIHVGRRFTTTLIVEHVALAVSARHRDLTRLLDRRLGEKVASVIVDGGNIMTRVRACPSHVDG